MNFTQNAISVLKGELERSDFLANENFTAVDAMIYGDKFLAFFSGVNCELIARTISVSGKNIYSEIQCDFEINLLGKSGDFCDYTDFNKRCEDFYKRMAENENLLVKTIKMGKVFQSMPLKRLERNMSLSVRIIIKGEISSDG